MNPIEDAAREVRMSIKTTLTNHLTIALQIIGGVLILMSMVSFRSGGMLWPMLGSAAGTWLLILGWQRMREKVATLKMIRKNPKLDHRL